MLCGFANLQTIIGSIHSSFQLHFTVQVFEYNFASLNTEIIYRQLAVVLMFTVFFVQLFNRVFLLADYYTNTAKYAEHCANKANPQMHCNGKCQMIKKVQQEDTKDQQNPERKGDNKSEILVYFKSSFASISAFNCIHNISPYAVASPDKTTDRSTGIFHPPQVS